jgi:diguanylate cyclase (GGDEF)-like protein
MPFSLKKPLHWPLQLKVVVVIMISQVLLGTFLLAVVLERSDEALNSNVKDIHKSIDTLLADSFIDPLLQRDFAAIQQTAGVLIRKGAIEAIQIVEPSGMSIAEAGSVENLKGLSTSDAIESFDWSKSTSIRKVNQIAFAGQALGTIRYSISLAEQKIARAQFAKHFISTALLVTGFSIALSCFLSRRMVTRIRAIKRVSDAAATGDFTRRVKATSGDELGSLAEGVNRMAESVHERVQALIKSEVLKTSYLYSAYTEKARLSSLLNSMRLGIVFYNNQGELIYSNGAVEKIWPEGLPNFVGQATNHGRERILDNGRIIFETSQVVLGEIQDGEEDLSDSDRSIGSLWMFEDITDERNAQMTIQFLAERDSLTGLYNRRSFTTALQQVIEKSPDTRMALVYIDLDNFKLINDLRGHQQGDKVLIDIASKLSAATRTTDVVARIGGDEFVVLVKDIQPEEQVAWCDRLLMQLTAPQSDDVNSGGPSVTCSVGLAWYPDDGANTEQLLAAADEAMYDAKRAGKNGWKNFQKHTVRDQEKADKILWTNRLNQALKTDGFSIFLQGVHHVENRSVHHFEALVRMPDPQNPGQYFNPGQFIGHAEQSGKITLLDKWMIKNSIKLLAANADIPPIAVNVSAISFTEPSLACFIAETLTLYGVEGKRLHLELTETAALADIHAAQASVTALQKLGCDVCLDDFGSGFASLAYLKLIDANYLKIDGLFIKGLNQDRENQVLLRAIIDIAKCSDRLTVAEWIEDEAMLQTIKGYGVDLAQGFHLSKPQPAMAAIEQFRNAPALPYKPNAASDEFAIEYIF